MLSSSYPTNNLWYGYDRSPIKYKNLIMEALCLPSEAEIAVISATWRW